MQELIDPDGANNLVTCFQWINDKVSSNQDTGGKQRRVSEEDKYSGIGSAMVEVHLPALSLLDAHPGALKGEVTYKMARQPGKQRGDRDIDWHRRSPLRVSIIHFKCNRKL